MRNACVLFRGVFMTFLQEKGWFLSQCNWNLNKHNILTEAPLTIMQWPCKNNTGHFSSPFSEQILGNVSPCGLNKSAQYLPTNGLKSDQYYNHNQLSDAWRVACSQYGSCVNFTGYGFDCHIASMEVFSNKAIYAILYTDKSMNMQLWSRKPNKERHPRGFHGSFTSVLTCESHSEIQMQVGPALSEQTIPSKILSVEMNFELSVQNCTVTLRCTAVVSGLRIIWELGLYIHIWIKRDPPVNRVCRCFSSRSPLRKTSTRHWRNYVCVYMTTSEVFPRKRWRLEHG